MNGPNSAGPLPVNRAPEEAARVYRTEAIAVSWEPELCIHTTACVRALPSVFRPRDRPWITLDPATADEVAAAVSRCPTGALHYRRLDGAPEEEVPDPPEISLLHNGPAAVRGRVVLRRSVDGREEVVRTANRATLCRCGRSDNMPFCSGAHRGTTFDDVPAGPPAGPVTGEPRTNG